MIVHESNVSFDRVLLGGIIEFSQCFDNYDTIKLIQPDGYKVDLLLRFAEWADCHSRKIAVRYWITNKETTFDGAQMGFLKKVFGDLDADVHKEEYRYSEWTADWIYDSYVKVGGHDLLKELRKCDGKWLWIEFSDVNG